MQTFATRTLGFRRLASMTLAEIGCRSRQEGSKWIDRLLADAEARDPLETLSREAPAFAAPGVILDELRGTFDRLFFAGVQPGFVDAHDPAYVQRVVQEADALMNGRFDLLGYHGLTFGSPIDWHLDPVWNRRSPLVHWSQIDALDPAMVGDSKVVWELNRHQWMVRLAQATQFTGDPKYGAHAVATMLDWITANPVGRGINWASSLEVALRVIAWTWVLALLRHTTVLTPSALTSLLASIHAHASHIQRYLSHYFSPNTHLTGEALGLFYAGVMYPQFADASNWRDVGASMLEAEATRQISDDGVYFEQSACYQRYSCDIYLHFLLLAQRSGVAIAPAVRDRVIRLVEFLSAVCTTNGVMPDFGDADGGWLMPLCRRDAHDCRGTLSAAASVFDRKDFACADASPESLWLTARQPASTGAATARRSQLFKDGGYAILRSGDHELIVDVGPLGCFGHGHADVLSVQSRIGGEPCLVDAGTGGYTAEPMWREYFRNTEAHNTVTVDHRSQAMPNGPFGWQSRPSATIREWQSTSDFDVIEAEHHAYPGVTHRRRVLAIKPGVFVLADDLLGEGVHDFELTFQFAPMAVTLSGLTACATTPGGRSLTLLPCSSVPLRADIVTGATNPIRGWVSAVYGRRTPAPAVIYSATSQLPVKIVTVLYSQT